MCVYPPNPNTHAVHVLESNNNSAHRLTHSWDWNFEEMLKVIFNNCDQISGK